MWVNHIVVDPLNMNIVLAGNSSNLTYGDGSDAYIMRISATGTIEWLSYINMNAGS